MTIKRYIFYPENPDSDKKTPRKNRSAITSTIVKVYDLSQGFDVYFRRIIFLVEV
jgi:hypothetical protein